MTAVGFAESKKADRLEGNIRLEITLLRDAEARAEFFAVHSGLIHSDVVTDLAEWVPKLIKTQPAAALAVADSAEFVATRLGDTEMVALAARAKGNVLHASGRNLSATEHHDRARRLFAKAGNTEQVARTLSASIQPLILLGEYDRAHRAAAEASSIFKAQGNEWRLARVELNSGNIFDRQDRFEEALECYERAYQRLLPFQQDVEAVAAALHNMAGCLVFLNDFRRANTIYEQARAHATRSNLTVLVGQLDYNLAWLHYLRGEYSRAISMLRRTRDACELSGDRHYLALCHLDLSEIYLELNMSSEAEEAAREAQVMFRDLGMWYEVAKAFANVGIALSQQGKTPEALESFMRARAIFVDEKNNIWCSQIDLYRAIALFDQNQHDECRRLANAALKCFSNSSLSSKAVLCHLLLARLHMRADRYAAAHRQCTQAAQCLDKIESPALSCRTYSALAQAERALGHASQSYKAFQRAKESLVQLREGIRSDEMKISVMRDYNDIYEGLVELCLSNGSGFEEAYLYIDQAKSKSLFDRLTSSRTTASSPVAPEGKVAARTRELREELNCYYRRAEIIQMSPRGNRVQQLNSLRGRIQMRERELLRLSREYQAEETSELRIGHGRNLTLEQIQQTLGPDETIAEYFQLRDQLIAALVSHDNLEIIKLGSVSAIEALLARLRFQMAKVGLGKDYVTAHEDILLQTTNSHLKELYKELFAPLRDRIRGSHVIVVPHGPLHRVPFHALHDGSKYLIDDYTFSYAPSASIYSLCHTRQASCDGSSLIFAIPDPKIPLVTEEAVAVAAILPNAELKIGRGATTHTLSARGAGCRFLHIATHGYFREDHPIFSGIRLNDSLLSLLDIYQLYLPVELVTLSGCSTGLNVVSAGDEMIGLVRGLICAGARASLLTLWDVQDRSTAEFMKAFYTVVASGSNKAHALRMAAIEVRKSHRHPYYWAPFVLNGKVFE